MIRLLKSIFFWASTRRHYLAGEYDKAIKQYMKLETVFTPKLRHRSYFATLLMLDGKGAEAIANFSSIADEIGNEFGQHGNDNIQYIQSYCQMYLSGLTGKSDGAIHYEKAKNLIVSGSLEKCLPLPEQYN